MTLIPASLVEKIWIISMNSTRYLGWMLSRLIFCWNDLEPSFQHVDDWRLEIKKKENVMCVDDLRYYVLENKWAYIGLYSCKSVTSVPKRKSKIKAWLKGSALKSEPKEEIIK